MSLSERFAALSELLRNHEQLWKPSPFVHPTPAWCEAHPVLTAGCLALTDEAVAALENDPVNLQRWQQDRLSGLRDLPELIALPLGTLTSSISTSATTAPLAATPLTTASLTTASLTTAPPITAPPATTVPGLAPSALPSRWSVDIPGRKWQQISAFAAHTPEYIGGVVDWCSGKSHLGRTIALLRNQPLTAIERDAKLCKEGRERARQMQVDANFVCIDVLKESVALPSDAQVLALHACGDLHRTLLQQLRNQHVKAIALAPCCYHLWLETHYAALSQTAQNAGLELDRNSVQLAVQEAVTSTARERKQTMVLAAWRLGFDALQRELRGVDEYMTTPSLPASMANSSMEAFCRRIAHHKNLLIPENIHWLRYQQLGEQRLHRARRLQLVRQGFRRALEMWLALDLALFLEESGYQVNIKEFCRRELTPRNILITGQRPDGN